MSQSWKKYQQDHPPQLALPLDALTWWIFDPSIAVEEYICTALHGYRETTSPSWIEVRKTDHQIATQLYHNHTPLTALEGSFILATERRANRRYLSPIYSLRYFLPIVDEIVQKPIDPAFLSYLWYKHRGLI